MKGSRKIWGTRRSDTTDCVLDAIGAIIPVASFSLKRKFRSSSSRSPTRWWYVVRADEAVLNNLVNGWSSIASERGWTIDCLHKFQDHVNSNDSSSTPVPSSRDALMISDSADASDAYPTSPLSDPLDQVNSHPVNK